MKEQSDVTIVTKLVRVLQITFVVVPVVAGLDKFAHLLTDWVQYLNESLVPFSAQAFMKIVGVIEIIAGILVLLRPKEGAYVVMIWLLLIALNLITTGRYLDIAVRDIVMSIAAYSLARLWILRENLYGK